MASQRERQRVRQLIAVEAVRLLSEGGLSSVDAARRKLQYDMYYIKHMSLYLEVSILVKTAAEVLRLRGR